MNIPQDQGPLTLFGLACLDMMDAGMQGDLAKGAVAFKSGLGNFFDHERRDERSEQRAAERLGAEARTEARTEAEGRMVDALKALTSEKKEP